MKRSDLLFSFFLLLPSMAAAQTTATLYERAVGTTGCAKSATAADFDALAQCTSTTSTTGTMQKAPLYAGIVTAPPYASTGCDSTKAGMIQYSATYGFLGCDGSYWSDVRQKNPAIGSVMPDGTIYAGGGLYTTPCDLGQTGTQGSCTGTRTGAALLTIMDTCRALNSYGHYDWFMPTSAQLYVLYNGMTAIGGFNTSGVYQSSTLNLYSSAVYFWMINFSTGGQGLGGVASTSFNARCVRRG